MLNELNSDEKHQYLLKNNQKTLNDLNPNNALQSMLNYNDMNLNELKQMQKKCRVAYI